jgi:hypothetical protein
MATANGKTNEPRQIVDELWRSYARAIWQGHKVSPAQHHETKLAFYAGGFEIFRIISTKIAGLSAVAAEDAMSALHNELDGWLAAERLRRLNHASAMANALRAEGAAPPPKEAAPLAMGAPAKDVAQLAHDVARAQATAAPVVALTPGGEAPLASPGQAPAPEGATAPS